jgi:hypothetical protein
MESIKQPPPNWEIVADRYTTRFSRRGMEQPTSNISLTEHFTPATATPLMLEKTNMQIVPQNTRELNTFRTMPLQCPIIQSLFSRINRFGATPNRICSALRRGDSTNTAMVDILFLAPRPEVPLSIGSMLTVLWKYTLMNWYTVDIEKKAFIKDTLWGQAIRRFAELCLVQLAKYRKAHAKSDRSRIT